MTCNAANPKGEGPVNIWQETFPVRFGAIDKSDRLTLNGVFQYFQEAAISHAENLNCGREEMERTGQVWVLSRMSVIVERRPGYQESVTVRSWPRGGEKLFAIRDYDIRDKNDIPVVRARSSWLIVDLEKRRPLRPQQVMDALPKNEEENALDYMPAALTAAEGGEAKSAAERKAHYTDIDYNGHVNNVRYIQWIEDTFDPQVLEKANKIRFDINYMNEILGGEIIELQSTQISDKDSAASGAEIYAFEGIKKENGQTAFRAELRILS